MPGDALSPSQLIHMRVELTWLSCNSRKCARHQAASNLLPNSFQLFHGVFAPEIQMRLPSTWNWLPLTVMRCAETRLVAEMTIRKNANVLMVTALRTA